MAIGSAAVREKDCVFTQFLQSMITNFVDLDDSLALVAPPTKGSPSTRLDPSLLYAQLPHDYEGLEVGNPTITGGDRMSEGFVDDTPEPPPRTRSEAHAVRYLHVVREYNAAADSLAGEALESKVSKVVLNDDRKTELKEQNPRHDLSAVSRRYQGRKQKFRDFCSNSRRKDTSHSRYGQRYHATTLDLR
ncbi:LOW QUALITY PROTEIN: hypothetical protein PHMEG_00035838 [Phytophthora megakarya]|uniref:Reverse transcriptase n=1 Tax=Phytophthora megakarya TaxID=4795 RepID=A0A225UN66_9STRA|nr:LOW QUALITY PROTEIN: hypothetical protein PHMEG_00035838 [Phytophthora megakarya]